MKIALIGYGKMGKIIEAMAVQRGHEIVYRATSKDQDWKNNGVAQHWDCAIEFTNPEAVVENLQSLIKQGVPTVCGSTGWNQKIAQIQTLVEEHSGTFITASNFSVGVNLFFAANRKLAQLMNQHTEYQVSIQEIHHTEKKDAPSGTAITTAEGVLAEIERLTHWELLSENHNIHVLPIEALRLPHVPGTHAVSYNSPIDRIVLSHEAHSREGFALGAILSAEYIHGKKGIFTIEEVLNIQHD
jgi:4-hydroxy-tetrahydrodipicolinate reductase